MNKTHVVFGTGPLGLAVMRELGAGPSNERINLVCGRSTIAGRRQL